MIPDTRFTNRDKTFWATVRTISQSVGYTKNKKIKVPKIEEIKDCFNKLSLDESNIINNNGATTNFISEIIEYFEFRSQILNNYVEKRLMSMQEAKNCFEEMSKKFKYECPIPMNKQKGEKKAPAYFTSIINMIIASVIQNIECDYDPRTLTTVTKKGKPLRTMSRRVDGAFPNSINPIAIWEIKEYYYTTTFGSRVADGVYETLLDGMELEELYEHENIHILHYLMVDAYYTWWDCGRSYLCRIIDMLHMGYVDEVLFGREVIERLPQIVSNWLTLFQNRVNK